MRIDVCYVADHRYAPIAAVSIISLLTYMKGDEVCIHLIDTGLDKGDRERFEKMLVEIEGGAINFYDGQKIVSLIKAAGYPPFTGNYSAYARLGVGELLPQEIKRLLYLDCDTLICGDIRDLFIKDIGTPFLAVQDILPEEYTKQMGFSNGQRYVNSGVLLINVEMWRKLFTINKLKECADIIKEIRFADQDIINVLSRKAGYCDTEILMDIKYNVLTPYVEWKYPFLKNACPEVKQLIYQKETVLRAAENPIILHLTDGILGRPWVENNHSQYKEEWMRYLYQTPFLEDFQMFADISGTRHKVMRWIYLHFPQVISSKLYGARIRLNKKNR